MIDCFLNDTAVIYWSVVKLLSDNRLNLPVSFLKVDKWSDAKSILSEWDNDKIENKRKECLNWWINYQNELQEEIKNKITTW